MVYMNDNNELYTTGAQNNSEKNEQGSSFAIARNVQAGLAAGLRADSSHPNTLVHCALANK